MTLEMRPEIGLIEPRPADGDHALHRLQVKVVRSASSQRRGIRRVSGQPHLEQVRLHEAQHHLTAAPSGVPRLRFLGRREGDRGVLRRHAPQSTNLPAALPSPLEQATIDRLGIFDEEKFAEIIEGDGAVSCNADECDRAAQVRILCRHCRVLMGELCTPCDLTRALEGVATGFRCPSCKAKTFGWLESTDRVPL